MKILLLQSQVYVPSLGGGNKANRLLLEGLACKGHECLALAATLTTRAGPTSLEEFKQEMHSRDINADYSYQDGPRFCYKQVTVETALHPELNMLERLRQIIARFNPKWILVSDDKNRELLSCAIKLASDRTVVILQTVFHLPFGPHAVRRSHADTAILNKVRGIAVVSEFLRDYLHQHGQMDAKVIHFPVYGDGPFQRKTGWDQGAVTLINPCIEKGIQIFLALASKFPGTEFMAVPTWGANQDVLDNINRTPNIKLRSPEDCIDNIFRDTRILIAPSLWPETFGYVIPEAMVRGIPVIASNSGGIPEAKLGVDYILPVNSAIWNGENYVSPRQDLVPWEDTLHTLLTDSNVYRRCANLSRQAALNFIGEAKVEYFEKFLTEIDMKYSNNAAL